MLHDNDTPEKISNNNVLHNLYLTTQKNEDKQFSLKYFKK